MGVFSNAIIQIRMEEIPISACWEKKKKINFIKKFPSLYLEVKSDRIYYSGKQTILLIFGKLHEMWFNYCVQNSISHLWPQKLLLH